MDTKLFALLATMGLVLFALGPGAATAAAAETSGNETATAGNDGLAVSAAQAGNDGSVTVTVTDDGSAVEGANVTVQTVDYWAYRGVGEHTTDADGTVELPAPDYNVTIEVTAEHDGETATTTADLVTAGDSFDTFGLSVSGFVSQLLQQEGYQGGIGFAVSEYATQNNPGNAPDEAGAGEKQGGPDSAAEQSSNGQGPPADKGQNRGVDAEEETETETENDTETAEDRDDEERGGPPADRGNSNGNGNAKANDR